VIEAASWCGAGIKHHFCLVKKIFATLRLCVFALKTTPVETSAVRHSSRRIGRDYFIFRLAHSKTRRVDGGTKDRASIRIGGHRRRNSPPRRWENQKYN
jgi:hypothetical protein